MVKVYSEDGTCRSLEVTAGATARHLCDMLVERAHCLSDESWSLVELHPHLGLGKCNKYICVFGHRIFSDLSIPQNTYLLIFYRLMVSHPYNPSAYL